MLVSEAGPGRLGRNGFRWELFMVCALRESFSVFIHQILSVLLG